MEGHWSGHVGNEMASYFLILTGGNLLQGLTVDHLQKKERKRERGQIPHAAFTFMRNKERNGIILYAGSQDSVPASGGHQSHSISPCNYYL